MSKDGNDAQPPAPVERPKHESADVQQARNASGQNIAATEGIRTNASDGSLRDRSKQIAEQEESIQIMGAGGRSASRLSKLSESDLGGKRPQAKSIDVRELLAKPEPEAKALVEQFGQVANMPPGAARDAAQAQVQQLADRTYGRGEFANQGSEYDAKVSSDKIQIGGRFYDRNQILASNDVQSDVMSDATNASAFETDQGKIVPKGYETVSKSAYNSGLDFNKQEVPLSQKLATFVNSAQARLLDPSGRKAYIQGMIDETLGVGEGLNQAKEEVKESTKIAAVKAWTALKDGSVADFISKPNAINEPLFRTIGSCLDTMARDPNAVNNVLAVMGRELQSASDKYGKMSPHDRGVQDGKAMFYFINPGGNTEGVDLAAKVGEKVSEKVGPHIETAVATGLKDAGKASAEFASAAKSIAEELHQAAQEFMQGGRSRLQTAGVSPEFFERPWKGNSTNNVSFMSKADDLGGGIDRPGGQRLTGSDLPENQKPQNIVNPIDRNASVEEKIQQLQQLSKENDSLIRDFTAKIDSKLKTWSSEPNYKAPEDIALKAKRPDVLEKKPWFDVEHVRDSLRFKTVVSNLEDLPAIAKELKQSGFEIVEPQLNKLLEPKNRGWRMAAIDLRAPNGQIIEYQVLPEEMQGAGKIEHDAYKGWREKDPAMLSPSQQDAKVLIDKKAFELYQAAWYAYLARTGQTEETIKVIVQNTYNNLR